MMLRRRCSCVNVASARSAIRTRLAASLSSDDHDANDRYYRVMNVTGSRPWRTAVELVKIIQAAEAR